MTLGHLYLAEKTSRLMPADLQGRAQVTRWCFAALNTLEPTLFWDILSGQPIPFPSHTIREVNPLTPPLGCLQRSVS
ncbi:hypothetical protein KYC5002_26185 [Archangium violaceum]|uniref:hypothetical protein n=1 Tax=Archangium violaceum TaxID=83451 RepID=UPI002B3144CD|nr:hypothetical protein KYC5002_26185 [Archangium gephyra]